MSTSASSTSASTSDQEKDDILMDSKIYIKIIKVVTVMRKITV